MLQLLELFRDDNSAQKLEPKSSCEEVTKINDETEKNSEKIIAVKGEILEGGAACCDRGLLLQKRVTAGRRNPPCFHSCIVIDYFFNFLREFGHK